MKFKKSFFIIVLISAVSSFAFYFVQFKSLSPKIIYPNDIKWTSNGVMDTAVLDGNPQQEGLYTLRIKIPANTKLLPHWHPENRTVVVLEGKFYWTYGEKYDESKLNEMPTGTFFTEPSKHPHFAWTKAGEVVLQVTGWGPTGTTYLNQDEKK